MVSKNKVQTVFTEDHAEHCRVLSESPTLQSVYGVKSSSVLNSLHYFYSINIYSVDIMHDLLGGVVQYELKLVFQYLVKKGYVTVNALSDRLHSFSYGYTDRKNRPGNLKIDDNSKHLGLNAAQSWCVLHHTLLILEMLLKGAMITGTYFSSSYKLLILCSQPL